MSPNLIFATLALGLLDFCLLQVLLFAVFSVRRGFCWRFCAVLTLWRWVDYLTHKSYRSYGLFFAGPPYLLFYQIIFINLFVKKASISTVFIIVVTTLWGVPEDGDIHTALEQNLGIPCFDRNQLRWSWVGSRLSFSGSLWFLAALYWPLSVLLCVGVHLRVTQQTVLKASRPWPVTWRSKWVPTWILLLWHCVC